MKAASTELSGAGAAFEAARLRVFGAFRPLMICWAETSSARAAWLRVPIARRARARVLENLRRLNFMIVLHSGGCGICLLASSRLHVLVALSHARVRRTVIYLTL